MFGKVGHSQSKQHKKLFKGLLYIFVVFCNNASSILLDHKHHLRNDELTYKFYILQNLTGPLLIVVGLNSTRGLTITSSL